MNNQSSHSRQHLGTTSQSAHHQPHHPSSPNTAITRRNLLKLGGGAALAGAGLCITGCSAQPVNTTVANTPTSASGQALPNSMRKPEPITSFAHTKEFDVVVVGAGASGVPAALSACEAGARVAVLQKESYCVSQGNTGSAPLVSESDPAALAALATKIMGASQHRPHRALIEMWINHGEEAINWVIDRARAGGAQVENQGNNPQLPSVKEFAGGKVSWVSSYFGPKPYNAGDGMQALAKTAQDKGVEFFFSTPAIQLEQNESGRVTGVIGQDKTGQHILFKAKRGVILAAGDYQNDDEMVAWFCPHAQSFERKQYKKTGDGHKMAIWAGAEMEPINHTKMLHDFDAGPASMCDLPFLAVNEDAQRFCDEGSVPMSLMNCYLDASRVSKPEQVGWYSQIFDATYLEQAQGWPGVAVDPEHLKVYMPEEEVEHSGVFKDLIRTFKAETLEELAHKLQLDSATLIQTIDRYNDMVAAGVDTDFGKQPKFLKPIQTPPFYGIHRHVRISAICAGVTVNDNLQVTRGERGEVIEGLWAVGNMSGYFYGGVDYPLDVFGMSLGRCYTQGYVTGKRVATSSF